MKKSEFIIFINQKYNDLFTFDYDAARSYLQYKLDEIDACEKLQISIDGDDFFDDFHDWLHAEYIKLATKYGYPDIDKDSEIGRSDLI